MQNRSTPTRGRTSRGSLALAAFFALATPATADDEVSVQWKGEKLSPAELGELPGALGEAPVEAIRAWAGWAGERGYQMALSDDGRALLLVDEKQRSVAKPLKLIERTIAYVDELLPAPVRTGAHQGGSGAQDASWKTWSDDGPPLDTATAVLLQARNAEDYGHALDQIAATHDYLRGWVADGKRMAGFVLQRPLLGAWLEDGPGLEEWDPENELVNRLAQLLVLRRFGQQPYWLSMGIAWHVEHELRGTIYCFPYRSGFVFASEHGAWDRDLKQAFKKTKEVDLDELCTWRRGTYQPELARRAWGCVGFVARNRPEALAPVLEELRLLRDAGGVVHHQDGTWERVLDFQIAVEDQLSAFEKHAGDDFLEGLLRFYQKGR